MVFKAFLEVDKRVQNTLQYDISYEVLPHGQRVEILGFNLSVAGFRVKLAR